MGLSLSLRDVWFSYPVEPGQKAHWALRGATCHVPEGAFCLLTGDAGSGKSTLLRLAKPELAPTGTRRGEVLVGGAPAEAMGQAASARSVGFVLQDPEAQAVASDVLHELAFCLESLGEPPERVRKRVGECAYYFGIDGWARRPLAELSGGQRQLVAVAASMVAAPGLLLLDEPTASLDPMAEQRLLAGLFRLNRELGVTVVMATHRPGPAAPYATCALRMEKGLALPLDVAEACAPQPPLDPAAPSVPGPCVLEARELWASYGRGLPWVLHGAGLELRPGEVRALVGGNGAGKTTLLKVCAGLLRPRRGRVRSQAAARQAYLPQHPGELLSQETVDAELRQWAPAGSEDRAQALQRFLGLEGRGRQSPWELSGGQRQLLCLGKLALAEPALLLADEPTRGLDGPSRRKAAAVIHGLARQGCAVLCATHDLGFARDACGTVSMVFDGAVACTEPAAEFFSHNLFYRP